MSAEGEKLRWRARWVFAGQTRSLLDTGRLMARWAEDAAGVLAPELEWVAQVREHADFGLPGQWQASHVVDLFALRGGRTVGSGESRLAAGGKGQRIGGSARVEVESVGPVRRLVVDNGCDVARWDVDVGGANARTIDAMRVLLEGEIGAQAALEDERCEPLSDEPVRLDGEPEDLALWAEDLRAAGLSAEKRAGGLVVSRARLSDVEALRAARVTLGEIFAEAGHEDWEDRALEALLSLPG
ncbi:MAG: hypothetical protein SangKO_016390 [Sandaracinaceae bacterium]|nr:MAG: hypothetical protein EVA89_21325 [Sandaracinaceae bacterium]